VKKNNIEVRIAKFEGDEKNAFVVPVNDERVLIEYTAKNGKHSVNISKSETKFVVTYS